MVALSPSPLAGGGWGAAGSGMTRNRLTLLGLPRGAGRAGRGPGQQVVDPQRPRPAGPSGQVVLLPVLNFTMVWNRGVTFGLLNGFGQWSYLLLAASRSPWSSPWSSGSAAPSRAWWRSPSAPSSAARSATSSTACASARWWTSSTPHLGVWSWYVFNLADAAIVCGVAALVLDGLLPHGAKRRAPPRDILATRPGLRLRDRAMPPSNRRVGRRLSHWLPARAVLAGCSGDKFSRTLGFIHDAPDEFTVTTRAPLAMPTSFALPPPDPGATRPQEQSERTKAEQALVPQMALGGPPAGTSPGQQALVQAAGPPAAAGIRAEVDQEAQRDRPSTWHRRQADVLAHAAKARGRGRSAKGGAAPA